MKPLIAKLVFSVGVLGMGLMIPSLTHATAPTRGAEALHEGHLTTVPKALRGNWGYKGQDYFMLKFSKTGYTFSDVVKTKSGDWVLRKNEMPYVHLKLGKRVTTEKTLTISQNKYGYWHLHYRMKDMGRVANVHLYYQIKGKSLNWGDYANGKQTQKATQLPTLASRKAFFEK